MESLAINRRMQNACDRVDQLKAALDRARNRKASPACIHGLELAFDQAARASYALWDAWNDAMTRESVARRA